jgi:hypothetical protein
MLGIFYSPDFWGLTLLGFTLEFPRTTRGRLLHGEIE